jgi:hypothetical protein
LRGPCLRAPQEPRLGPINIIEVNLQQLSPIEGQCCNALLDGTDLTINTSFAFGMTLEFHLNK